MGILVHISGNVTLRVEADLETFEKAYKKALASDLVLRIRSDDGKVRVVNPRQISFFEDEDREDETASASSRPGVAA